MIRIFLLSVSISMLSTSAYANNNENSDGCESQSQACTCSFGGVNTGSGKCDSGSAKPGLYCHCGDYPPVTKIEGDKTSQTMVPFDQCNDSNLGKQCLTMAGTEGTCRWVPQADFGQVIACD